MLKIKNVKKSYCMALAGLFFIGCVGQQSQSIETIQPDKPLLISADDIKSFNPIEACHQGCEVVENNPWDEKLYRKIFARIVERCNSSRSEANAGIIKDNFVNPLRLAGKVPPDIGANLWNSYFSYSWVSLPSNTPTTSVCERLGSIKRALAEELILKEKGFQVTNQRGINSLAYSSHLVYNWAHSKCAGY